MAEINGINVPFIPIDSPSGSLKKNLTGSGADFTKIFQDELNKIKFSNHALKRMESRNIQIGENEVTKLQNAMDQAESKGAKDSLVMMKDTAFIVNVPNRTVVTAVSLNENESNIFTNIDSVVLA